ncbi:hypothetical protein CPU12_11940 [Malaciobacter molluscorum LMG 25693]|uniref:Lipoprotein n=1 Tax=Malaciobacter molluscorum LMG 25693 TaxID=870501 RepID=A0A2G1DF61_9BACT|nr:hypothetical protein [Malaciobacter molluscorum]AXX91290.1 hypothetical protein AMOL_0274 [Malaciobacter molluscorum LMG 25693]PHO17121.1 hypothetical protein CPU12_11940 [Malaciobacter molluscorum LMG 25693]RXJ92340.1 hypothetical protein CRV00_13050 [Malaciobacter molluscorum]
MKKSIFVIFISIIFSGCLAFQVNNVSMWNKNLKLTNNNATATYHPCTTFSYYIKDNNIKYGKLFIEYVDLDSNCMWNGFPRSFFEDLFKQTQRIQNMKVVEQYDYDNFEFTTYLINNESYINLIYNFTTSTSTFILDYSGKLSNEYIKSYNKNYISKYMNKKRYSKDYEKSLVTMANFYSYFSRDSDSYVGD